MSITIANLSLSLKIKECNINGLRIVIVPKQEKYEHHNWNKGQEVATENIHNIIMRTSSTPAINRENKHKNEVPAYPSDLPWSCMTNGAGNGCRMSGKKPERI